MAGRSDSTFSPTLIYFLEAMQQIDVSVLYNSFSLCPSQFPESCVFRFCHHIIILVEFWATAALQQCIIEILTLPRRNALLRLGILGRLQDGIRNAEQ